MKIAFFTAPLLNHGGGVEKHFMTMANEMAKRGHQVSILNLSGGFYKKLSIFLTLYYHSNQVNDLRLKDSEVKEGLKNIRWIVGDLKKIQKNLKEFDVVYSKNEIIDLLPLKLMRKKYLPPVLVGIHTPIYYPVSNSYQAKLHNAIYLSFFYRWLLSIANQFRVLNSDDKKLLKRLMGNSKKIVKIMNPIDTEFFRPVKSKTNSAKFKITFAGRLNQQKGVDLFVQIIDKLSSFDFFNELLFSIAGSGDEEPLVNAVCQKYPNVRYLKHIAQKDMLQLYTSHDLVVAPSRYETMHWVSLESQSCGVPVVASNIPGPREIILDNKTGFLVKVNPEDFVEKIVYLYNLKKNSPERFAEYKLNARENILAKFSYINICSRLENVFKKTITDEQKA
ncbi:glycosyltransferase family 1 protein [Candidatus Microgenomates bacterium]|jgi:glycosyltransferase involved in cell wall biosynthesis|nr:MAG: glycosyltransferase family 1 protein [Candidatus Microgenomates bacterium]